MTWSEWRSMFRFDRTVDIPHLSVTVMCPYVFVRGLWYFNRREFQAYPSEYETSLVIGWRWPFARVFREKKWAIYEKMPLALYGAMDAIYMVRADRELGSGSMINALYIAPTVRELLQVKRGCAHNYWIANCPECARKALSLAVHMTAKYQPKSIPDLNEPPIVGFRRREAEAQAKLKAGEALALPAGEES